MGDDELVAWTPELEVDLFNSMQGHKPVGKDWEMAKNVEKGAMKRFPLRW